MQRHRGNLLEDRSRGTCPNLIDSKNPEQVALKWFLSLMDYKRSSFVLTDGETDCQTTKTF